MIFISQATTTRLPRRPLRVVKASNCKTDLFPTKINYAYHIFTPNSPIAVSRFNASPKLPEQVSRSSVTSVSCKTSRGYHV